MIPFFSVRERLLFFSHSRCTTRLAAVNEGERRRGGKFEIKLMMGWPMQQAHANTNVETAGT